MGEDSRSHHSGSQNAKPEKCGLGSGTPDLNGLPHSAAHELSQDVTRLQTEKMQLIQDIADLQAQYQTLQSYSVDPEARPIPLEFPAAPLPLKAKPRLQSQLQIGLWFVLSSTLALSIHNVVVKMIIGNPISLLGLVPFGGFIQPNLGNSLLILWMRMLIVVPLMSAIAAFLYPPVWGDIKKLVLDRDRRALLNVVGSGGFLFLSQVLIYIAIGQIGPGPAVTILFMYPLVTVPLAWWLFGDRPTRLRLAVMVTILVGVVMAALPNLVKTSMVTSGGVFAAILAGIAFAFYLIFMQLGFRKLHPVPVSLVQFMTILFLSSLSLTLPLQLGVAVLPEKRLGLFVGGLVLGALTLIGYLSNNFGVRYLGAARSSIIASSGPVFTAVLAAIIIHSQLQQVQVFGILLVTIGVTALSFERMRLVKATSPAKLETASR